MSIFYIRIFYIEFIDESVQQVVSLVDVAGFIFLIQAIEVYGLIA